MGTHTHTQCSRASCAMALLHSRVARVFYVEPNADTGALGSRLLLHTSRRLNHRFLAFRVVLGLSSTSRAEHE
eukprot:m.184659 g.184659  ORF g.184659 m.184659 type:complete len:73 (-) comp15393_c2_seq2:24-242(-)